MNDRQLLYRVITVFMLATLCLLLLAATSAQATPIQPDVRQMPRQAQRPAPPCIPARAGWKGPEMETHLSDSATAVPPSFHLADVLHRAAAARAMRSALRAAAIPDPRILAGLGALILLLRKLRDIRESSGRQPQAQPA